ncbi:MAG: N-acetylmuramoyl-L-alanine amidase [Ruminococcus sp.]|nr:N-acetylmuramoyl-L-alanine amidase [Ruminococcus sp.]MCD7801086.1 N-acetylmuramoyl-L-alanine amidase [Ruminococcus sp.]
MYTVFLSPSTQEFNQYATEGNEELYMNILADRMEPYLRSSGIKFSRNDRNKPVTNAIADSNAGNYDIHFALHTNAGAENFAGKLRGIDIYYDPDNVDSRNLATITANNLQEIYPLPNKARALPTDYLGEVLRTKAVAVLCELGYHDNPSDERWLKDNLNEIARNLSQSICDYFGIPLIEPIKPFTGTVVTNGYSNLNIRNYPSIDATVIGTIPNSSNVMIYGIYYASSDDVWYVVEYNGIVGYSNAYYIVV